MKRFTIFAVLMLGCTMFLFDGCKKEKKVASCDELINKITEAATAFGLDPTEATCKVYYDAIHDFYDGCATITPALRAQYDAWLESVDCSVY
jgi:hypothetical protein